MQLNALGYRNWRQQPFTSKKVISVRCAYKLKKELWLHPKTPTEFRSRRRPRKTIRRVGHHYSRVGPPGSSTPPSL